MTKAVNSKKSVKTNQSQELDASRNVNNDLIPNLGGTSSIKTKAPYTYSALRTAVRQAIALGKERAVQAVEREKVRTSWEIGQLILEHILLKKDRADYGAQVVLKLSKDLGVSASELGRMVEFARAYPISAPARKLSWSHYQKLLSINDADLRNKVALKAEKENWSRDQLRSEVNKMKAGGERVKKAETLPDLKPGTLDVFRTRVVGGRTLIDLGFSTYVERDSANTQSTDLGSLLALLGGSELRSGVNSQKTASYLLRLRCLC